MSDHKVIRRKSSTSRRNRSITGAGRKKSRSGGSEKKVKIGHGEKKSTKSRSGHKKRKR